ncbi:hypothetical protein E6C60_0554 [Paenibacillus algicola]|uniref:Uncharacterized protein n=1 Tax=Paenibacillus algicola TaxID=2565926 RepID=A0A4P8XFR1_9BACL|nr:hypothetical protein E6C60_0554 [Paenibacillus algicola]
MNSGKAASVITPKLPFFEDYIFFDLVKYTVIKENNTNVEYAAKKMGSSRIYLIPKIIIIPNALKIRRRTAKLLIIRPST